MDIVIWDYTESPPEGNSITILWRSYGDPDIPSAVSIPRWVEEHDQALRSRYLSWIYDLGNTKIDKSGRRLIDHLCVRPGFSSWWMTLLAEKCNFAKSPQITDAIKLMAFDDWAKTQSIYKVVFASANIELAKCLQAWCAKRKISFRFTRKPSPKITRSVLRAAYFSTPPVFQALIWLVRHVVSRLALRGAGVSEWKRSNARVTFVSYLFNLVPAALAEGRFDSRYWTQLPDSLDELNCKTNWLHIYIPHELIPNANEAKRIISSFNQTSQGNQVHVTLDSFMNRKVIQSVLLDWARLALKSIQVTSKAKKINSNGLVMWPLFAKDWHDSLSGKVAMSNLIHLNLLDSACQALPLQRVGVYLQENMDWEFALIWAWKAAKHKAIVGYPHSTVRYWDLRYHCDERCYIQDRCNSMPMPDKVAINGFAAMKSYEDGGYPRNNLVKAEALRYNYLKIKSINEPRITTGSHRRILVLGEFLESDTEKQMNLLEKALGYIKEGVEIIVKPHPASPFNEFLYPNLSMKITNTPVEQLLKDCDMAYTGVMTSAAVDAYCYGIPVISLLDPTQLNLHPLRGELGVWFVTTPEELARAIGAVGKVEVNLNNEFDYFYLDDDLQYWHEIILH
jgi:surface carbohydrate biosynthesis protein (TIGR04326 family)